MDTPLQTIQSVAADASVGTERRFLNRLFWGAFAVRAAIGLLILLFGLDMFNGDNTYYEYMGWVLSEMWGGVPSRPLKLQGAGDFNTGMYFWVAAIYFLVGARIEMVPLTVNWAIGAFNAVLIYHIGKRLFNQEVARIASLLVAYLPGFAFWSALLYKDGVVLFFIALGIYAALQLQQYLSVKYAAMAAVSLLLLQAFRAYTSYLLLVAMVAGLVLSPPRHGLSRWHKLAVVGVIIAFAVAAGGWQRVQSHLRWVSFDQVLISRADLAQSAASGYLSDAKITSAQGALTYLPKGLAYLLLAPAPWQFGSPRQTLAIPETLLWYALIPSTFVGMAYAWKSRRGESITLLTFTFALTIFYAFFIGNIGTAVRERAQIFAFWFIFAAAGLVLKRRGRIEALER
jgi:hypothetical protein